MWDDGRNAVRQWRRSPGAAAIALLSLTAGIGGTIALFSLVDALLLRPLPVFEPERLVRLVARDLRPGEQHEISVPTHVWEHIRDSQTVFESVLAVGAGRVSLRSGAHGRAAAIAYVDTGYFETLGVRMVRGRGFRPSDEELDNASIAVIAHSLWQGEYGGRPDIVGRPVYLDNHRFDVIGVAPQGFFGLEVGRVDEVIVPLGAQDVIRGSASQLHAPVSGWLQVYGRVRTGETVGAASAAIRAWYPVLRAATRRDAVPQERHLPYQLDAAPAARGQSFIRDQYGQALSVLLAAVGVLLLIACTNVAVLAIARVADRRHEVGVRLALGATRPRIVRLLFTESLLLAIGGGAAGLWLGHLLAAAVAPYLSVFRADALATELVLALDSRTIAAAIVVTLLSAAISGLGPAIRQARVGPLESLSGSGRGTGRGRATVRTMRALASAQVALALVLLAGASLLARSFVELTTAPSGIDRHRVLVAAVTDQFDAPNAAGFQQRVQRLKGALATIPGVTAVSAGIIAPLTGMMAAEALRVPGSLEPTPMGGYPPFNYVLPGFFDVLGTPILMGRDFTEMDVSGGPAGRRGAAIVNQAFAQRHFGGFNPIGRVLIVGTRELDIVGVVANARARSLHEDRAVPFAYGALAQHPRLRSADLRFVMRADDPAHLQGAVLRAIRAVDPRIFVDLRTLSDAALSTINRERLLAWAGSSLAMLGLLIAVVGVYGTFAYAVVRRRVEIGVRVALGATRGSVIRLVLGEAALVIGAGLVVGTAAALAAVRSLQSLLFGISARDGASLALSIASMLAVAGCATLLPARRAAAVQPATALRAE